MSATPADVLSGAARFAVVEADALDVVPTLPAACVDALVTDPPSGIAFMGAEWDRDKGGRAQWCAWLASILGHARAATKDGGRALVWSLPRTSHWTGCAVEDAGWAIETKTYHLFGGGFPKGKTQLKPAVEEWVVARTGPPMPLNIDACRVQNAGKTGGRWPSNLTLSHAPGCVCVGERRVKAHQHSGKPESGKASIFGMAMNGDSKCYADEDGLECVEDWRCVDGCPVAHLDLLSGDLSSQKTRGVSKKRDNHGMWGLAKGGDIKRTEYLGETGGASRFFNQFPADEAAIFGYHAKPPSSEKKAGVDEGANNHPTVKSIALMRWLVRLVTRPGDVVLDPFGGSGTTGVAALMEGRRVILVERDPRFAEIARQRCAHATPDLTAPVRVPARAAAPAPAADPRQRSLFDLLAEGAR